MDIANTNKDSFEGDNEVDKEYSLGEHQLNLEKNLQNKPSCQEPSKNVANYSPVKTRGSSIAFKISGSIVLMILLIGFLSLFSISGLQNTITLYSQISATSTVAKISAQMKTEVYQILLSQRAYATSNSNQRREQYLSEIQQKIKELQKNFETIVSVAKQTQEKYNINVLSDLTQITKLIQEYQNQINVQIKFVLKSQEQNQTYKEELEEKEEKLKQQFFELQNFFVDINEKHWEQIIISTEKTNMDWGRLLSKGENFLWKIRLEQEQILNKKNISPDAIHLYIQNFLEILERLSEYETREKLLGSLQKMRNQVKLYQNSVLSFSRMANKKSEYLLNEEKELETSKENITDSGAQILKELDRIIENNWEVVANYQNKMEVVHSSNMWILLLLAIFGLTTSLLVLIFIPRSITKGFTELTYFSSVVADGDLTKKISVDNRDELGILASSMEIMRGNLFNLIRKISQASLSISSITNEITASGNQQSVSSTEVSAQVNQLNSSMNEQIASMTELRQSLKGVDDFSQNLNLKAKDSIKQAKVALHGMESISEANQHASERIQLLRERIEEISKVLEVISEVADQTNMLSLNASIEASKAGNAGKGFTVVATEIRRLADRSMLSARNVNSIILDIQRSADSAVMSMQKSSEEIRVGSSAVTNTVNNFSTIVNNIKQIIDQTDNMSLVIGEQTNVLEITGESLQNISDAIRLSASAAQQISSSISNLNNLVNELRNTVVKFSV